MKQKLTPNTIMDFVAPEELAKQLQDQTHALLQGMGKNAAFRRVIVSGPVDSSTNFVIDVPVADGFVWDVRAYAALGANNVGKATGIYINDNNNKLNQVASHTMGNNWATIPAKTCIVHSGEKMVVANGVALTAPDNITVMVAVVEVPMSHMADLLL